ncbi:MAG: hypothetical protein AAF063_34125 [Cyanobacteria bacterium J06643_5]
MCKNTICHCEWNEVERRIQRSCGSSQDFEIASLRMSYRTRFANAMTITILILQNWDAPDY